MACVIWKLPNGDEYKIVEGKGHIPAPGAVNTGRVDWDCAGTEGKHEVDAQLEKNAILWGSAIKWVTSQIGIKQCSACKAREVILNHASEVGWAETIKQIAGTFKE